MNVRGGGFLGCLLFASLGALLLVLIALLLHSYTQGRERDCHSSSQPYECVILVVPGSSDSESASSSSSSSAPDAGGGVAGAAPTYTVKKTLSNYDVIRGRIGWNTYRWGNRQRRAGLERSSDSGNESAGSHCIDDVRMSNDDVRALGLLTFGARRPGDGIRSSLPRRVLERVLCPRRQLLNTDSDKHIIFFHTPKNREKNVKGYIQKRSTRPREECFRASDRCGSADTRDGCNLYQREREQRDISALRRRGRRRTRTRRVNEERGTKMKKQQRRRKDQEGKKQKSSYSFFFDSFFRFFVSCLTQRNEDLFAEHLDYRNRQTLRVKLLDQIEQIRTKRGKHHAHI